MNCFNNERQKCLNICRNDCNKVQTTGNQKKIPKGLLDITISQFSADTVKSGDPEK